MGRLCFADAASDIAKTSGTQELGLSKHYKNNGMQVSGAVFLEPESCMLELSHPKHYKNNSTQVSGAIFLEPESSVPLLSPAVMLRTLILLEKKPCFDSNRKILEEMLVWVPFLCGGARPGPKSNYAKNITGNHYKKSRDHFGRKSIGNLACSCI